MASTSSRVAMVLSKLMSYGGDEQIGDIPAFMHAVDSLDAGICSTSVHFIMLLS